MSKYISEEPCCNVCFGGEDYVQWKCLKCSFWAHPFCWSQMLMNVFHLSLPQEYIIPSSEYYRWQERLIIKCPQCKTEQSWEQLSTARELSHRIQSRVLCFPWLSRSASSHRLVENHRGTIPALPEYSVCVYCYEPLDDGDDAYGCRVHPMHHICAGIVYGFGFLRPFCPWCGPLNVGWLAELDRLAKEWLELMMFAQSVPGYEFAYNTMYYIREDASTSGLMATDEYASMFFNRYATILQKIDVLLDTVPIEEVIYTCGFTTINYLCYRIHYLIESSRAYTYRCFHLPAFREIRGFRAKWRIRIHEYCERYLITSKYRNRVKVVKNYSGLILPGSLVSINWV